MADKERKCLVWDIRKSLLSLSPNELFRIATSIGTVPGKDPVELSSDDAEGCFEFIHSLMYSKDLLESEDRGMSELLALKDVVDDVVQSHVVTSPPELADTARANTQPTTDTMTTTSSAKVLPDNIQQMLLSYEDLSKKLLQFVNCPTSQDTTQPALTQPTTVNSASSNSSAQPEAATYHSAAKMLSLKELPYIQHREFKVQGGPNWGSLI